MGTGEICGIAGEFAMLISLGYARRGQQGLVPGAQLAIAARYPAISRCARAGWKRLPPRPLAKRANVRRGFDHVQPSKPFEKSVCLTLHPNACFPQGSKTRVLCTTCEGAPASVEA